MNRKFILNACGIAIGVALGMTATPGLTQDSAAETVDIPGPSYDTRQPSDIPSPAQPGLEERDIQTQPEGARGPIRSEEDMRYQDSQYRGDVGRPAHSSGYIGFLRWRESNSNTP